MHPCKEIVFTNKHQMDSGDDARADEVIAFEHVRVNIHTMLLEVCKYLIVKFDGVQMEFGK
eukprot:12755840-Ditylum_brightwellii.AAC.1